MRQGSTSTALWFGGLLLTATGCLPAASPPMPTQEEVLATLSAAVLAPETTCQQLQEEFELTALDLAASPADVGLAYEEHMVVADDGYELPVWYMPVDDPRGVAVVSHGSAGTMACYLFTAQLLADLGWSVVFYEYRGFGGTPGSPQLEATRDDLHAVVQWTRERTGAARVTLMGLSIGAVPTVAVAVRSPEWVGAVVLDSPVALGPEIERFDFLINGQGEAFTSQLPQWMLTEEIINRMEQPLLVFTHELDVITPPQTVTLLFLLAGGPKTIVGFSGVNHAAGQFEDTDRYVAELDHFLTRVWD
jgi:acetyl esterase/lipase